MINLNHIARRHLKREHPYFKELNGNINNQTVDFFLGEREGGGVKRYRLHHSV